MIVHAAFLDRLSFFRIKLQTKGLLPPSQPNSWLQPFLIAKKQFLMTLHAPAPDKLGTKVRDEQYRSPVGPGYKSLLKKKKKKYKGP